MSVWEVLAAFVGGVVGTVLAVVLIMVFVMAVNWRELREDWARARRQR